MSKTLPTEPGWYWYRNLYDKWVPAHVFWDCIQNGPQKETVLAFYSFRNCSCRPEFVDNTKPEQWGKRIEEHDGD